MSNPLSSVTDWVYHLGEVDSAEAKKIAATGAGLVVVDLETSGSNGNLVPYTEAQVDAMRATPDTIVVSYLSIGEAEEYRDYWTSSWNSTPPDFLAAANPEWPDNYEVKYWDPDWQQIVFDRVDKAVASGFDGVYLDIIDSYQFWESEMPNSGIDYAGEMAKFVAAIRARGEADMAAAGETGPFVVIGQNAEELVDNKTYLDAIDGLAKEDLRFIYENGRESRFHEVPDGWYDGTLEYLQKASAAGVEIFVVEYMTQARQTEYADALAQEEKDLAGLKAPLYLAEERDLLHVYSGVSADPTDTGGTTGSTTGSTTGGTTTQTTTGGTTGSISTESNVPTNGDDVLVGTAGNDTLNGLGGNDTISGQGGDDKIDGGAGHDVISGGNGNDSISGNNGDDVVNGDAGRDLIYGRVGNDRLFGGADDDKVFGGGGNDLISGGDGDDRLGGGDGNDILIGGAGNDWMHGGSGVDLFVFENAQFGNDKINSWEDGIDKLDFTAAGLDYSDFTKSAHGKSTLLELTADPSHSILIVGVDPSHIDAADFV